MALFYQLTNKFVGTGLNPAYLCLFRRQNKIGPAPVIFMFELVVCPNTSYLPMEVDQDPSRFMIYLFH